MDISDLQYQVLQKNTKPTLSLAEDYCNVLSQPGSFSFSKSTITASTCGYEVTEGLTYERTDLIQKNTTIPMLASKELDETVMLNFASTRKQETTHTDQWTINTTIPVPANTYVKATYVVMEDDFDCTWTASIKIRGCANVWFKDKVDGHWEWWHYVHKIYSNVPGFSCWYSDPQGQDACLSSYCTYTAQGKYYGIGEAQAHLNTQSSPCKGVLSL